MSKEDKDYIGGKITIQSEDRWPEIKEWRDFQKEKQAIKDRYPNKPWETTNSSGQGNKKDPFEQDWWEEWCKYKNELTDLMLTERGNFSKFLYKIKPEREDVAIRIWLRGKYNTEKYNRNKHKNK